VRVPRSIAITGLRSFVGKRVLRRVREAEPEVQVHGIDLQRPYGLDPAVRFHAVDLADPTSDGRLAELLQKEGVEAVLHAAFRSQPRADVEADHELETIGTLHLLHACAAARVRRLVLASSTMLYGPRPDNPNFLDEDHPLRGHPAAHNVANRVEVEELVATWRDRHQGVEVTVLRPCWVMGPGYEEDCLRAFEIALLEGRPGVFNVVGRGVLPLATLLRTAGKHPLPIPAPLLYRLGDQFSQVQTGDPPAGFYDYLRYLWVADGERGWAAFGEPEYTTLEAWMSFVSSRRMRRYR